MRVHFKNSVEVASAIRGLKLSRAKTYLEHVLEKTEAVPFNRFKGGRGRHAQAKNLKVPGSLVGWPQAAVKAIQSILLNAEANAESKGLDTGTSNSKASMSFVAPLIELNAMEGGSQNCNWHDTSASQVPLI